MAVVKDVVLREVISDAGESAKTLNRPGVQRLLEMVRKREIAGFIITKLDRLTRTVRDLGVIVDLVESRNVTIISTHESLDTSTATGRMVLNITAAVAQWEREAIAERTSEALQAKKKRGERTGNVPYGYRAVAGKLVENELEQATIAVIRSLRRQDKSLQQIASELNATGYKTRKGGEWKLQYVDAILRRHMTPDDAKQVIDKRYDELKSGAVKPIDGEQFFEELKAKEQSL